MRTSIGFSGGQVYTFPLVVIEEPATGEKRPPRGDGAAIPSALRIVGSSMEPTLGRGWRVVIAPVDGDECCGQIVLIRGSSHWIVHRVILRVRVFGEEVVFHRGDGAGKVGWCSALCVCGRVVRVVEPENSDWTPAPPDRLRWSLKRCRLKCRFLAMVLGLTRWMRHLQPDR